MIQRDMAPQNFPFSLQNNTTETSCVNLFKAFIKVPNDPKISFTM